MAIFRTIRIIRTVIRLAYKLSRLTKKLEKDMAKARKGKLKPKDIQKTAAQIIALIAEFHSSLEKVKDQIERTVGPELRALTSIGLGSYEASKKAHKIYKKFS